MKLIRTMPLPDTIGQVIVNGQLASFEVECLKDFIFNVLLPEDRREQAGTVYHHSLFIKYEAWLDAQQSEVNKARLLQGLNGG